MRFRDILNFILNISEPHAVYFSVGAIFNLRGFLAFPRADTVGDAKFIADGFALRFFFFAEGGINGCHNHVGYILGTFLGKVQHGLEGLITKTAADQFVITVCIWCVQADRYSVDQTLEFRGDVSAVDQIAETVGVDSDWFVVSVFEIACHLQQNIDTFCWFTETAEDEFIEGSNIEIVKISDDFVVLWFAGQPQ